MEVIAFLGLLGVPAGVGAAAGLLSRRAGPSLQCAGCSVVVMALGQTMTLPSWVRKWRRTDDDENENENEQELLILFFQKSHRHISF